MAAGFYGKVPMRGDFVGRLLGQDFIQPWDGWLQSVLQAGQTSLEEAWLDRYLNSPIWYFVLGAGQCGPAAMVGVMIASVDSVGRYFPLTIAAPLEGRPAPALAALAVSAWCAAAETVALGALEPETTFTAFESAVASLAVPDVAAEIPAGPAVTPITDGLAASLLRVAADPGEASGISVWWTEGTPDTPGVSLRVDGLPPPGQAVALFDGQWERWGWIRR
jgi:type VI secretion system protein ImpM